MAKKKSPRTTKRRVKKAKKNQRSRKPISGSSNASTAWKTGHHQIKSESGQQRIEKKNKPANIEVGSGEQKIDGRSSVARQQLIDAARELFHSQGYAATGIAQILEKANVGSGSLYYFFGGKEDLLCGVLDWYQANLWPEVMTPVFEKVNDPIDRIFGVLYGYRQALIATGFTFGCPIGNLALELTECKPETRERIALNFDGWKAAMRQCLDAAASNFVEGVDLDGLAAFVLTVMEGAVMQSRSYRKIEPYDQAVAQLRDYFSRLMKNR